MICAMNRNEKPRAFRLHDIKLDKEYAQWIQFCRQCLQNWHGAIGVRLFEIDGNIVQRDLYSAFITGHTLYSSEGSLKPDTVDYEFCANDFENFINLQNKELERLTSEKKLSWYINW